MSTTRQFPRDLGFALGAERTMPECHEFSTVVDHPFEPWPITDNVDSLQPRSTLEQGVHFCNRTVVAVAEYASLASLGSSTNLSNGVNHLTEGSSNSALLAAGSGEVNVEGAYASLELAEDASLRSGGDKTARPDQQGSRCDRIDSPAHSDSKIVGSWRQQHSCHRWSRGKMSLRLGIYVDTRKCTRGLESTHAFYLNANNLFREPATCATTTGRMLHEKAVRKEQKIHLRGAREYVWGQADSATAREAGQIQY